MFSLLYMERKLKFEELSSEELKDLTGNTIAHFVNYYNNENKSYKSRENYKMENTTTIPELAEALAKEQAITSNDCAALKHHRRKHALGTYLSYVYRYKNLMR